MLDNKRYKLMEVEKENKKLIFTFQYIKPELSGITTRTEMKYKDKDSLLKDFKKYQLQIKESNASCKKQ